MVSFTYEDYWLEEPGSTLPGAAPNQRNIGVSKRGKGVEVTDSHERNHDGAWFSVLVSRTVRDPRPGSDEISRAIEEGWIGKAGYTKIDGNRQRHALAFQGLVTAENGYQHWEVFIVDLPEDLTIAGPDPLEGTLTTMPAPPANTVQRRLTFTDANKFPGIQGPRHWLRSSPDGSRIAFLMKDDEGVVQVWTVSPNGGEPQQLTQLSGSIESAITWSPEGAYLAAIIDQRVTLICSTSGMVYPQTEQPTKGGLLGTACVFSPNGKFIAYQGVQENDGSRTFPILVIQVSY